MFDMTYSKFHGFVCFHLLEDKKFETGNNKNLQVFGKRLLFHMRVVIMH